MPYSRRRNEVRFGSAADITRLLSNIMFTPQSGQTRLALPCPLCARSRHRHHAAADLLEHLHGCERFSRPRPETIQCELCLLSGLDINKEVVVLLLRRLALPIEVSRIARRRFSRITCLSSRIS